MKWETDSAPSEQELAAWTRRMIDYNRLQVDAYAYAKMRIPHLREVGASLR
jgi:hypothetical protein